MLSMRSATPSQCTKLIKAKTVAKLAYWNITLVRL